MNKKQSSLSNELKTNNQSSGNNMSRNEKKQEIKNRLSINLKRKIEVKRYPIIAQLTLKQERPDLVSLLKATQESPDTMPLRLMEYLKRERLWDSETFSLTDKGIEILDTGYVDVNERGLYHIWYTNNDELLGTRPLFIQRDKAFFEPMSKPWKKGTDARTSGFEVIDKCFVEVWEGIYDRQKCNHAKATRTLVSLEPEVICSPENSAQLDLEWQVSFSQSEVSLKGQLNVLSFSRKNKDSTVVGFEHKITSDKTYINNVLEAIATEFDGCWDESTRRISVMLEKIQQYPHAIQNFVIGSRNFPKLKTALGTFDGARIHQLPITPLNRHDAEQWHQAWLNHYHSEHYRSASDARQQQSIWLDHEAMVDFDLPLKSGQELLDCFERERNSESYWHVAAMEDLSPSRSRKKRLSITLMNNDMIDINELVEILTGGDSIQSVIYSDRYVHTSKQIRNLNSIASYFEDADGVLMTLKSTKYKNAAAVPENWQVHMFNKYSDNHGRYWIFIGKSYSWCWECTSGLDFIREDGGRLIVDGTPSFIPKEENELPQYLQHKINTIKTSEVI
ncbi:hypothetical protein QSU96_16560 [Vibrio furnissii]|uniref:hypothetical protein n=1 Tax=Vibrio furnissii TaxID=29494 RepID=UPI00257243D1|nr:hypothetical protein [Vibrio furnissii]WJG28596.1 hypothetical protein QSU96_16560 [Vibrio furnissii]